MTFTNSWLDTLIEEKNINTDFILEVEGNSGPNYIPVACVIEAIKSAPIHEKNVIQKMMVRIDFANGSILDYIKHLAQAIAI